MRRHLILRVPCLRVAFVVLAVAMVAVGVGPVVAQAADVVATLTPAGAGTVVSGVEADGDTVVAVSAAGSLVFQEPATGWANATPSATLVDPGATGSLRAAVSGSTIVVEAEANSAQSFVDVFQRPAAGWTGTIAPSARLVRTDSTLPLLSPRVDGDTVVAWGVDPATEKGEVFVFVEPATGWSGTIGPVAVLTDSHGAALTAPAVSGASVVAGAGIDADVFVRPASGWAGPQTESARLIDSTSSLALNPVAVSGATVLAGWSIFQRPAHGWSATVHPSAFLIPRGGTGAQFTGHALSSSTAGLSADSLGVQHACPCASRVWLFNRPVDGWRGGYSVSPFVSVTTSVGRASFASQSPYAFVSDGSSITVYAEDPAPAQSVGAPVVSGQRVDGLTTSQPALRLTLRAGKNSAGIGAVTLTLPKSLSVAKDHGTAARKIQINGHRAAHPTLTPHTITVALSAAAPIVTVSLGAGALAESKPLRTCAARRPPIRVHRCGTALIAIALARSVFTTQVRLKVPLTIPALTPKQRS